MTNSVKFKNSPKIFQYLHGCIYKIDKIYRNLIKILFLNVNQKASSLE